MSTNKMSILSSGNSYDMTSLHDSKSRPLHQNLYEALEDLPKNRSDGIGFSSSPSSSGGSTSRTGYDGHEDGLLSPFKDQISFELYQRVTNGAPSEQICRTSVNNMSLSADKLPTTSSAHSRIRNTAKYSSGSPQKLPTSRRPRVNTQLGTTHGLTSTSQEPPYTPLRDALISQTSPTSRSGRASFNSPLRTPTMAHDPNSPSLKGIPEILAVQEMAFRQGQHDHGVTRDRLPSSPFAKHFDQVWAQFYVFGKEYGGKPIVSSTATLLPSSHQNFPWPVLINPYTQDLERPNGAVDAEWVRKVCTIALNCMQALIRTVCKRQGDWRKIVCDVPTQIKQALMGFDDLRKRYELLQQEAHEAVAGGLPYGY